MDMPNIGPIKPMNGPKLKSHLIKGLLWIPVLHAILLGEALGKQRPYPVWQELMHHGPVSPPGDKQWIIAPFILLEDYIMDRRFRAGQTRQEPRGHMYNFGMRYFLMAHVV